MNDDQDVDRELKRAQLRVVSAGANAASGCLTILMIPFILIAIIAAVALFWILFAR